MALLGINTTEIGFEEAEGFRNIDKIHTFYKPTVIIHAEKDHIIPFSDGETLFEACPAPNKTFLKVPEANHNNILMHGLKDYLAAIAILLKGLAPNRDR